MLRKAFPIDSHVEFETDGTPIYDRAITSAPLRKLIKSLVTDGVLPNPSTNMQVSAGSGMNVLVEAGFALCNGCMAMEESQRTLAVQASDTTYDRIDTVVLRLNDNDSERTCDLYVLQGVPASTPIRPTLTRTESIWEIGLADLFITPHSAEITNQRITDTRYETERCGVISAISEFDTTTIYNQVQADLVGFKEEEQARFVEWFDYMKNQLSEDAAGNLQLQINDTNEKIGVLENLTTSVKDTIVGAINWLKDQLDALVKRVSKNEIDISALNSNLEKTIKWRKIWTNPSPNASFSAQNIATGTTDYDVVKIYFRRSASVSNYNGVKSVETIKGYNPVLEIGWAGGTGSNGVSRTSANSSFDANYVKFGDCYAAVGDTAERINNDLLVPLEIWLGKY